MTKPRSDLRVQHAPGGQPMSPECRLALVIPYLNESAHLPACLDSLSGAVSALDVELVEVVLVDNGSADQSTEIASEWAAANQGKCPVHLIREPRQGPGWARSAGASAAFARAANRMPAGGSTFWVLSADSDCAFPETHLTQWLGHLQEATSPILAGNQSFGEGFAVTHPVTDAVIRDLGAYRELLEATFQVINTDGFNHAIERTAYAAVGPYRQPVVPTAHGPRNAAGEDWDLGARARAAGIRPQRVESTIVSSPRRVLADPRAYFTGAAYEGEFRRVEGTLSAPDVPAQEYERLRAEGRRRMLLHYACKPFLIDQKLQEDLMARMLAPLRADMAAWTERADAIDLDAHRNELLLGLLAGFWENHALDLAEIAHGGTGAS
jgi:GT2 family glycosyltransferase